jgi:hypothetical protein
MFQRSSLVFSHFFHVKHQPLLSRTIGEMNQGVDIYEVEQLVATNHYGHF